MTDTAATAAMFMRDICADPGDDTVRLIYADWLEEQGEGERANFIRWSCYYSNHTWHVEYYCGNAVCCPVLQWPDSLYSLTGEHRGFQPTWRRGFLEGVALPCADFLKHAEALFRAAPITRVTLSDKEPEETPDWVDLPTGFFLWWWYTEEYSATPERSLIPLPLWQCLHPDEEVRGYKLWQTPKAAQQALSTACVRFGRQLANLLELPHAS